MATNTNQKTGNTMNSNARSGSILILFALLSLLPACGSHYTTLYRAGISQNQLALQDLRIGMSSADVRAVMGEGEVVRYKKMALVDPWRSEGFALVDGTEVLILFYLTQPQRKYYRAEDQELTPIVLENDKVVGWGWSYLRSNTARYRISTPLEQR